MSAFLGISVSWDIAYRSARWVCPTLSCCGVALNNSSASPSNDFTYHQHLPGYLHEFIADTLRQMAVDACGLASHALGADGQPLELPLLVELLRIAPVLKCGVRTAVHNAGRDSRDSEREREYDV